MKKSKNEDFSEVRTSGESGRKVLDSTKILSKLEESKDIKRPERKKELDALYRGLVDWFKREKPFDGIENDENEQQKYEYLAKFAMASYTVRKWKETMLQDYGGIYPPGGRDLRQKSEEKYKIGIADINEIKVMFDNNVQTGEDREPRGGRRQNSHDSGVGLSDFNGEASESTSVRRPQPKSLKDFVHPQEIINQREKEKEKLDIKALEHRFENAEIYIRDHLESVLWSERVDLMIHFWEHRDPIAESVKNLAWTDSYPSSLKAALINRKINILDPCLNEFQTSVKKIVESMEQNSHGTIIEQAYQPAKAERKTSENRFNRLRDLERQFDQNCSYINKYWENIPENGFDGVEREKLIYDYVMVARKVHKYKKMMHSPNTSTAEREKYLISIEQGVGWIGELDERLKDQRKQSFVFIEGEDRKS